MIEWDKAVVGEHGIGVRWTIEQEASNETLVNRGVKDAVVREG